VAYSFALLASYYGWTDNYILSLTVRKFFLYLNQIEKIDARLVIRSFDASGYPHMKDRDRSAMVRHYQNIICPEIVSNPKVSRIKDSWNKLRKSKLRGRKNA